MRNDSLLRLQYILRSRHFGRLKLRPGLPGARALENARSERELEFYNLLLNTALASEKDFDVVIDVGCRNGSYLSALAELFPRALIIGNELDPGRRYWNLWRRGDYAEAYARALPKGKFIPGDFRLVEEKALPAKIAKLGFTFFYPFVSRDPCRGWGLPGEFADYSELVSHARALAERTRAKGAWILSAHQGEWEADIAREIYASSGLAMLEVRVPRERFAEIWPSPHEVFLFRAGIR